MNVSEMLRIYLFMHALLPGCSVAGGLVVGIKQVLVEPLANVHR